MTASSLPDALPACAAGIYTHEAGVSLLIGNRTFLSRDDFTSRFIIRDTATGMAAIDWAAAITALDRRNLSLRDDEELREADPDTLRYRIWHIAARLAVHARQRTLKISPGWPWKQAFPPLLAAALHPADTRLTTTNSTNRKKGDQPRRGRSRCAPRHTGHHHATATTSQTDTTPETGQQHDR
jgi:hypothetical protein